MESKIRRVIKRNGEEVSFDVNKILNAIRAANNEVEPIHKLNEYQIAAVGNILEKEIMSTQHATSVEDIQDMVERGIMEMRGYEVAQKYVRFITHSHHLFSCDASVIPSFCIQHGS